IVSARINWSPLLCWFCPNPKGKETAMKRQRIGTSSGSQSYHRELLHAIGKFLPRAGLPLQSRDHRIRWTDRLLAVTAMLMSWQSASSLKDAFEGCWHVVAGMYPTRR